MKLLELLNILQQEDKDGLINIDDWAFTSVDHLKTMGFEFDGDYSMSLDDPPIRVTKKKQNGQEVYVIEEEDKQTRICKNFEEVVSFFDHYPQKEFDKDRD